MAAGAGLVAYFLMRKYGTSGQNGQLDTSPPYRASVTGSVILNQPVDLGNPLTNPAPAVPSGIPRQPIYDVGIPSIGGATIGRASNNVTIIMTAEEAHSLIKRGQWSSKVRGAKMSRYYTWGDFFKTENPAEGTLSAMQNGLRLAQALDILCDRAGYKVGVNSWHRTRAHQLRIYNNSPKTPLGSRHIVGDGIDIAAGADKLKLYRIARSIPQIRRVGYPTNGSGFLHLDLMNNTPANQQQIFVDNNTVQHSFRPAAVLPANNTASYGT